MYPKWNDQYEPEQEEKPRVIWAVFWNKEHCGDDTREKVTEIQNASGPTATPG